jgi:O-antigen/teichoic acid export membrane protein
VVAAGLSCVVAWLWLARGHSIPRSFDWDLLKRGLAYAMRAHLMGLVAFMMARTATVILRATEAFDDLGQWSIAAQISDAFLLLPGTVALLFFPTLVKAGHSDRWSQFKSMALRIGAVMALLCIGAAAVARPLVILVFGAIYEPAVAITLALLPGVFFLSVATIVSQFLASHGIPWTQIAAWIFGWSLQIALSVFMVQKVGALGLAWIQSLCVALVCIWLLASAIAFSPRRLAQGAPKNEIRE